MPADEVKMTGASVVRASGTLARAASSSLLHASPVVRRTRCVVGVCCLVWATLLGEQLHAKRAFLGLEPRQRSTWTPQLRGGRGVDGAGLSSSWTVGNWRGGRRRSEAAVPVARRAAAAAALRHLPSVRVAIAAALRQLSAVKEAGAVAVGAALQPLSAVTVRFAKPLQAHVPMWMAASLTLLGFAAGFATAKFLNTLRVFRTAGCIPAEMVASQAWITGRVINAADGDGFRMRHMPLFPWGGYWKKRRTSDDTIQVRICAADAPELPHMGKPGQPFGEEAKRHLEKLVLNQVVRVKMLSRDQYNRIVGLVLIPGLLRNKNLSVEMLRAGMAVVYRQGGAQYDGKMKQYELAEQGAIKAKKGVWSQKNFQKPSEFKAQHK
eukprot:CAMPEP_0177202504 /NCGR_PEP_ID=MMETSP0367-20130122/27323_1 /TAXON_ID=447022 ORGANISM="Scrippsiella hangoei-like, Strain SHHI-4" /NCGR_SAMPLE_ID=MMETSP0367 /ASSEMBLY_ACC=CAM_ASM_000362 /LENGTH=379 /DNA_ID=CAMNT_0018651085 /DNA_START=159 /DNA_END=1298 /DNA_ORIENTATION=-